MQFAGNAVPDLPAHFRAFVARLQYQWILWYMSTNRECFDQTAGMHMLILTFAIRIWHKSILQRYASYLRSVPMAFEYICDKVPFVFTRAEFRNA